MRRAPPPKEAHDSTQGHHQLAEARLFCLFFFFLNIVRVTAHKLCTHFIESNLTHFIGFAPY